MDGKLTYNREYSDNYPTVGYGPPNYLYNLILWIGAGHRHPRSRKLLDEREGRIAAAQL